MFVDLLAEKTFEPYQYVSNNPIMLIDPDGTSPISALVKQMVKLGVKKGIIEFVSNNIEKRLKNYMSKELNKQFRKDLEIILDGLDSEWWEILIELTPGVGDAYGTAKFGKKVKNAYDQLQNLENKYVEKTYNSLSKESKEKFKKSMRSKGVSDARADQKKSYRDEYDEETYVRSKKTDPTEKRIEGHHLESVSTNPEKMTDPRNIRFKTNADHKKIHSKK